MRKKESKFILKTEIKRSLNKPTNSLLYNELVNSTLYNHNRLLGVHDNKLVNSTYIIDC